MVLEADSVTRKSLEPVQDLSTNGSEDGSGARKRGALKPDSGPAGTGTNSNNTSPSTLAEESFQHIQRKGLASRVFRRLRANFFSSLTRRIAVFNILALAALVVAILYMNQFRAGLIDAKIESLLTQGRIIAGAIAGSATANPDAITIDPDRLLELQAGESLQPRLDALDSLRYPINPEQVAPVLRTLISPTQTRARIYDPDGILVLDSRHLYGGGQILRYDLPPVSGEPEIGWIDYIGNILNRLLQRENIPIYRDLDGPGTQYPEVASALIGAPKPVVRMTEQGELTVSVAVPIQRYRVVLGVLLLSTEGDDIDRIVTEERLAVLRIFLVAAIVSIVLSILLAGTIANPLRKLSEAAVRVKRGVNARVNIPDFSNRQDEIGDLSTSLGDMTNALYSRIEAIERFAADVSHELKNPLTSLRSAVETLPLAKTPEAQERLLAVIQHDVQRLDRLITDISDASRLDADLARDDNGKVDLEELLQSIISANQDLGAGNKQVEFEFLVDHQKGRKKGFFVLGHEGRLGQVVNNLIDNAISFVPANKGKITIRLSRIGNEVVMVFEDNGPGIQAENVDRIFERFYTDRSENDGFGQNSGLGLSISRQIVEAHGGTIHARNRSGGVCGAVFTVRLPVFNSR